MKIVLIVVGLILFAIGVRMIMLAGNSPSIINDKIGLLDGNLKACGSKPNCVSTQAEKGSKFYIEPITGDNIESLWDDLNMMIPDMGMDFITNGEDYIHCYEASKFFGFVDDVEFLLKAEAGEIQMRSQSRVGYSDLGVNRKRLEKVRKALLPK